MSTLKIALLGTPEVFHFDRRLTFPDRKSLALLAYFAAEGGMHERQQLSRLFWPDSDLAHARTALRITLHHLRRILEDDAQPEHKSHLLISHDALRLDMDSDIELDLHTLQDAWSVAHDQALREEAQGEIRRILIDRLQHAANMYRGSFLQDFTLRDTLDFDNWVGIQQGYWYQRIEQVFDWLSQLLSAEGELDQAIAAIERWRSFDPLNEDISLRLMQFQFAAGNRIAALRTFETYQEVLKTELSVKPSAQMFTQAAFIRNAPAPGSKLTREQLGPRPSHSRSVLAVPFVGRGTEIGRLMSLYKKASHGQPQVVVLEGEAGIGKSRLAATFLDWARAQGADVLEGKAFKSYQHLAYQPLVDPLRTRLAQELDLRQLLSDIWLAELVRLLPELRERYPDLPPPNVDEAFESSRFLEALARLEQALAAQAPLLIFIDDMQWTDNATLDIFQYLGVHWAKHSTPVMLLLSRRVETRSTDLRLVEWFAQLKIDVPLTRLELGPLSEKDTLQIVLVLSGEGGETGIERFATWLFVETKGQPFFVRTTLETLLQRGVLVPRLIKGKGWVFQSQAVGSRAEVPGSILPSDVREMIQRRLSRLSSPTRELLAAGAILDHDFTFEALCQVAQLTTQDGLFALDEAIENLLLQESHHQSGGVEALAYLFAHDKIL